MCLAEQVSTSRNWAIGEIGLGHPTDSMGSLWGIHLATLVAIASLRFRGLPAPRVVTVEPLSHAVYERFAYVHRCNTYP